MGNICQATATGFVDKYEKIDINKFRKLTKFDGEKEVDDIIGQGGFAVVFRVRQVSGDQRTDYAMKTMSKLRVSQWKSIQPTLNEMFILRDISHPFLVDMRWAFHDRTQLYLIMKEQKGKDLRFHITNYKLQDDQILKSKQLELDNKRLQLEERQSYAQPIQNQMPIQDKKTSLEPSSFNENMTRFFIAQLCLALNYLHTKSIIHRDIKPENILFESDGYIRIIDLGIAKVFRPNNNTDTSGTTGYMAPEVLCRQNHNYAADYYAVGVIAFELMLNKRPYEKDDINEKKEQNFRNEQIKNILQSQILVVPYDAQERTEDKNPNAMKYTIAQAPKEWSLNGIDFINKVNKLLDILTQSFDLENACECVNDVFQSSKKCLKRKPTERLGYYDVNEVIDHPWFQGVDFDMLLMKKYTVIPFSVEHMKRSVKRNSVQATTHKQTKKSILTLYYLLKRMKYIEDQLKEIDQKLDDLQKNQMQQLQMYQQQRLTVRGKTGGGVIDDEEDYRDNNVNLEMNFLPQAAAPMKEQEILQENILPTTFTKEEEHMLNSIQHLFNHYYFDRERYEIELKYLEDKKNAENSKSKQNKESIIQYPNSQNFSEDRGGQGNKKQLKQPAYYFNNSNNNNGNFNSQANNNNNGNINRSLRISSNPFRDGSVSNNNNNNNVFATNNFAINQQVNPNNNNSLYKNTSFPEIPKRIIEEACSTPTQALMRTSFTRASMMAFNGGERGGLGGVASNLNLSSVAPTSTARPGDSSVLDVSRSQQRESMQSNQQFLLQRKDGQQVEMENLGDFNESQQLQTPRIVINPSNSINTRSIFKQPLQTIEQHNQSYKPIQ